MTDKEKILAFLEGMSKGCCPKETKEIIINIIIPWINDLPKKSVSENYEEAIEQSFIYHENRGDDFRCDEQIETSYRYGFETGANWQKEQIMAKAVDVSITIPYQNGYGGYSQIVDSKEALPFGDNIKVLVIKES